MLQLQLALEFKLKLHIEVGFMLKHRNGINDKMGDKFPLSVNITYINNHSEAVLERVTSKAVKETCPSFIVKWS